MYANTKLKITAKKNIVMSFKPYTEKIKKRKIGICSDPDPDPDPEPDPEPDPLSRKRIRICIKMKRIRNTDYIT